LYEFAAILTLDIKKVALIFRTNWPVFYYTVQYKYQTSNKHLDLDPPNSMALR
jgi:hypothetical protein